MPVFNQSRKTSIQLIFIAMFVVIIARLLTLQVFSNKYKIMALDQGIFRKIIYPDRGIVYDKKGKVMLDNTSIYDLMVVPAKIKGVDTMALCNILNIDTVEFKKRMADLIFKNTKIRPSIFEALLSEESKARLDEVMFKFEPAFYLQERSVRNYPYDAAANVLGYIAEVDTNYLKKHKDEGYAAGDYAGMTGIEHTYEKVLMGERGIEYWKRDNKNRLTEKLENGKYDTAAVAGQAIHTSIDIELQELGEKLMQNKLGSIVAVDPKTGGILAMISAPTYQPKYLTGNQRRKHFSELFLNPALPLLNRTVSATYSPGSTFKTLQALIGLHEGVITTDFRVTCSGAFYGCGYGKPMKCLDKGTFDLRSAITISDNTYFATVMQRVIDNSKYPTIDSSLSNWDRYMSAFGLGHKLGVDVPSEKRGNIPTPEYFNKTYGKGRWNYCNFRSVSIGQGEVSVTPLQVANEMAYIANKGWYYIPHVVDSIEGGDKFGLMDSYKIKHTPTDIPDSVFEAVRDGMQGVVDRGTGIGAKIKDIVICGKTGTVENYYHGEKQPNHTFFCGFAPRENPKIAIMCVIENSGHFGGTYSAPIVGLMIEKYLKDSITDPARLKQIETLSNLNLMPKRIYLEVRRQDSLRHSKDSAYLLAKGYIKLIKDSIGLEDDPTDIEIPNANKERTIAKDKEQKNNNTDNSAKEKAQGILPNDDREIKRDTAKKEN
ncbi:penicillin-binding transpeptidase domain-containing protein [Ferruginibacter albus]|uniref:penicillin-binding transpeptidase domain-containing protein n=1 Tax=Ferruginibacter albus TaxID=2875540 RepID=UPI001CC65387|nr:penicillin-binding transpeptidase domain-containing protein [Ferruginibacter albus]UAY52352.1 penicillin-binding protein 2 [Ferruginibacter albus]